MSDINKVLVLDDRLHCTDQINFAVQKGASSLTYSQFNAVSATPNQINFNVQVPSQESLVGRDCFIQADLTFTISVPTPAGPVAGQPDSRRNNCRFMYGKTDALAPFPLHQCILTSNTTINNNTTTINTRDVLPVLLKLLSPEALQKYEATTPVLSDSLFDYNDAVSFNNKTYTLPDGNNYRASYPAFPVLGATSYHYNVLGSALESHFYGLKGRGTHVLKSITKAITPTDGSATVNNRVEIFTVVVNVTEPLLMSPWIFRGLVQNNSQSFYGISNMNFQFTIDSTASRAWRYADGSDVNVPYTYDAAGNITNTNVFTKTYQLTKVENCKLLLNICTAPPELLLPPKNIVPYYELPLFRTSNFEELPRATVEPTNGSINYQIRTLTSNSLHLSMIPDSLIIYVKRKDLTNRDSDHFACIKSIQIQFDTVAGMMVNATQEDLWRMSVENGVHLTWDEFRGATVGKIKPFKTLIQREDIGADLPLFPKTDGALEPGHLTTLAEMGVPFYSNIATVGSIVMLDFGKDISLPSYYAPSSLGSFNLQIKVEAYNQSVKTPFNANQYELVIITKNSGIMVHERGTTSQYLGLLTKSDCLGVAEQEPYKRSDVKRLVGNGWFDNIKSAFMNIAPRIPSIAKSVLGHFRDDSHLAKTAHDVLDHLGYGKNRKGGKRIDDHLM